MTRYFKGHLVGSPNMDDFDKIYDSALKKAKSLGIKYTQLLEFEHREIKKQGAEQYWVDTFKSGKKFKTNKNLLVLPYLLNLTTIDPTNDERILPRLKNKLDIKLDPGAFKDKDMPDIDLDFIPDAKDDIRDYAAEQYGADKVCSVGLWQTYKPRSSLKDVAKSLGYKEKLIEIEKMTKDLPDEFDDVDMKTAIEEYQDFKEWYEKDYDNKKIANYAFRLVGKIKTQGKHAGGLIIASVPLDRYLPIAKIGSKGKEKWTSEWTEGKNVQLSKFGFVKYDVLGLKTMQYVYEASKLIEKNHGVTIDWDEIGYNDVESFKTANELKTDSIFQFDTDVAKGILSKGGVKKLTDILVYTSLGRPGPMPMVDEYILRRDSEDPHTKNKDAIGYEWKTNEHPKVLSLLGDTLGITVFQEQVSLLLTELAGFTLPEAEKARKIMSKKWKDQMVWVREKILKGFQRTLDDEYCPLQRPEIDKKDEERIQASKEVDQICGNKEWTWSKEYWKRLETFARYSFNKCLDAETIIVDPLTNEKMTIEDLYKNPKEFHLQSINGIDSIEDIHYNGEQEIFEIEFENGKVEKVTINHKYLCSHDQQFHTVKEIVEHDFEIICNDDIRNGMLDQRYYNIFMERKKNKAKEIYKKCLLKLNQ